MTALEDSIVVSVIAPQEGFVGEPADTGRERRASERAIRYWQQRIAQLGDGATIATLDFAALNTEEWSYRFIMTVDSKLDGSALLLYGADVGRLLGLPVGGKAYDPMIRRLPERYVPVFRLGCSALLRHNAPVRVEGKVEGESGRPELFRAIFIPLGGADDQEVRLAFGAFSRGAS
jgi:hypothetical protein